MLSRGRTIPIAAALLAIVAIASPTAATAEWKPQAGAPFSEPQQIYPVRGVTDVKLTAKTGVIKVAGSPVIGRPFNRSLIGPTLHVRPGGTLRATIRNLTDQVTNIHWHGLHVDPKGISDNVFRSFGPGSTTRSVVRVPRNHPAGTFWYHVHLHGLSEGQVMGGLSGLLIIDGIEDVLPKSLRDITQRQFAIRDLQTKGNAVSVDRVNPKGKTTRLVNGLLRPRLSLGSGETQLWRIGNVGADLYYNVALEGHTMRVIAEDGSPVWRVRKARSLLIPPGKRFDVLVTGGKPGSYGFRTTKYDQGFMPMPNMDLTRVRVTGPQRQSTVRMPVRLKTPNDSIAHRPVARKREFTFSFGSGPGFTALINGEQFDPSKTNVAPILGTVEEWTLINETDEDHPFHIHVNDFQVMSINGKPYNAVGRQDVVNIPKDGGRVVIRNPYDDFTGHFVFHCHILGHEDAGMMQTIEVVRRGQKPSPPPHGGKAHAHSMAFSPLSLTEELLNTGLTGAATPSLLANLTEETPSEPGAAAAASSTWDWLCRLAARERRLATLQRDPARPSTAS